ncbi:MAG: hypothetical protein WCY65_03700 [Candidatus Methanomethylophilaceae archaeon]
MIAEVRCQGIAGSIRALPSPQHSATALMLSSMTGESSTLRRPSLDDDFIVLLRVLRSMGLAAELRSGDLYVQSEDMGMTADRMDVGSSETAFCMVSALASNIPRRCTVDGSLSSAFPMHPYVNALLNLGVTCEFPRQDWKLPLNIRGPHRSHMTYLPGDSPSIMFLSLALSSLYGVRATRIEAVGTVNKPLLHPCDSHLMTEFGVHMDQTARSVNNPGGQRCRPADVMVPGDDDLNEFLVCLALMHGSLKVLDVHHASPGIRCLEMAGLDIGRQYQALEAKASRPEGPRLDAGTASRSLPLLMVAASSWKDTTRISFSKEGMTLDEKSSLREAMDILRKMGCHVVEEPGILMVPGTDLEPVSIRVKNPFSGLMAILAASRCPGTRIVGIERVEGRYPGLLSGLRALDVEIIPADDDEQVFLLQVD